MPNDFSKEPPDFELNRKFISTAYEELNKREQEVREQLAKQQDILHKQEIDIQRQQKRIKEEQISREREYQKERIERERIYEEREKKLLQRQSLMEELFDQRLAETEALKNILQKEIIEKENQLAAAKIQLQVEKEKYTEESRKQLESKSESYVNTALKSLEEKENSFHESSKKWAKIGVFSIIISIIFISATTYSNLINDSINDAITWEYLLFIITRGLIVVALFIALARYAFIYSNSYMHESLKNGDRRHAINFGKFYLETYGANANWDQIKEAFQHWNMENQNAFSKKKPSDFDPKLFEKITAFSRKMADKSSSSEQSKNT
jgi:hypothetical protein